MEEINDAYKDILEEMGEFVELDNRSSFLHQANDDNDLVGGEGGGVGRMIMHISYGYQPSPFT